MRAYLDCFPCFLRQTIETSRLITSDEKKIRHIINRVSLLFPDISSEATPPEIGREVYRIIRDETGVIDPYNDIKKKCIEQALSLYPEMKKIINSSEDRLLTAIKLSIAGNIIDFGANPDFELKKDINEILVQKLNISHYQEFCKILKKTKRILYLADNAGETVFDRLLIEELKKPVIYAVREKPIINDATREDAYLSGIHEVAEVISTGCDAPGTILKFCSNEFLEIYKNSDLIISKGQGNYEGLSDEPRPIFFLLKAKCSIIAQDTGVEQGDVMLLKAKNYLIYQ
ncbi:ARMT1-like domain-containing protein [Candidatus Aminicenantes bacterium AC-708-M15]|jgi:hypothetical protein|nr:ARMT1-like domain-containing protein [SCandidatus Aminicenantes bacterium Aminicenantia_JdfR_composite]MCP2596483.1 ARMT1-like domain-containing protein [Candidatus Aminicenantes bacterium AC-335-G13]MCP2598130.1 ARMT1-like domain-containing protein [Candidatus Aminicenantes bacterium AC-335-L06]MCP2603879.1 ARMT1-like domain-containing protein [Candidatus Aminicenantes bacterium AC-708-M15]MCP2606514.1 ARMT1-like domain-containing protein [Candidatus Aminicenantes bacterium AC-708-I09]MCP2